MNNWYNYFYNYYKDKILLENNRVNYPFHPIYIGYKITERCNQNCIHCWSGKNNNEKSTDEILDAIDKLIQYKPFLIGISGGEPFIRDDCIDIIKYCVKHFFMVEVLTNATLLDEGKIQELAKILRKRDYLHISFDGTEKIYNRQRNSNLYFKLVENVRLLVKYGIHVNLHFTCTDVNVSNIVETYKTAKDLGVNIFSITYTYPLRKGVKFIDIETIKLYEIEVEKLKKMNDDKMILKIFKPIEITSSYANITKNDTTLAFNFDSFHWTIDASGDIYHFMDHCSHKDLKVGNIYDDEINILSENDKLIQNKITIRDMKNSKCSYCSMFENCNGGDYINNYPKINIPDGRCIFNV